jgi:predicted ABC-type ATPase
MEDSLVSKIAAVRRAADIGCFGAHQISNGEWMPCSSTKQFLTITNGFDIKSRISLDDMENWSSIRKSKGKKRKKRWEKLRERRVLGIESLNGGGLVSPRNSTNMIIGGTNPPITYGASSPSGMSTKSVQPAFMPRDNDPDVFVDIESARKRAQQLGCIGVSRRMSKSGKVIWMPCTNITDYNNLTGMTSLGRTNLQKRNEKIVRTVIKENLKKKKTTIQEDIYGKALGPRIRGIARAAVSRFDANAFDGDEDGLIQDGTTFERPSIPTPSIPKPAGRGATPKLADREVSASEVSAVRKFINAMTSSQMDSFRGEPIEAYDGVPGSRRGMASRGPGFIIDPKGPKQMGARTAPKPLSIAELKNPEASPTNPFRNLGGRLMGKLIRGMVKPEHRKKQDRTTFLIGGNTGSGKTTVLDGHLIPKGLVPSHEEAALIDPDFIKKGLPGYNDGDGAGRVHRESQVATDKTIRDAASDEMDMVITGSGASRQLTHMREAVSRDEKVVGHWVHVPQNVASQRIRKRMDENGRYIPDNTAHMAASIPRAISSAFEEDLLDEFYLWDNNVPEGDPPKLIAQKVRGKKFEVFDQKKFEEFAGDKKWADRWVETADGRESRRQGFESRRQGFASGASYDGAELVKALSKIGFQIEYKEKILISIPEGTPVYAFFKERVQPWMKDKSGRHSFHRSRLKAGGEAIANEMLFQLGIDIDRKNIMDKNHIKKWKILFATSDNKVLAELFARAPINGPNGESRFGDLKTGGFAVETPTLQSVAEKVGVSESQISRLVSEGFSIEDLEKMSKEEIKELLEAIE